MLIIMRLFLFAILALVVWKVAQLVLRYRQQPKTNLQCETCRFCELIDQDGVMCRYGENVTLKTIAHVHMCQDYLPELNRSKRR